MPAGAFETVETIHFGRRYLKRTEAETWSSSPLMVMSLLALHAGLGLAMHQWPAVATAHGWVVGVIALTAALSASPARVAMVGAYIAGSDVLWRLSGALVFWEFAKYITAVMFAVTLIRRRAEFVWRPAPLLYFLLLIPSVLVLVGDPFWDSGAIRDAVSFGLSGPLALAMSIWFLSQVALPPARLRELFILGLAPVAGIAAVTLISTYSGTEIQWTGESNFVTSGGFGPNQVSTVLGLAALFAFFASIDLHAPRAFRWIMAAIALLFLTQCVMTFSRGGVYGTAAAAILASITVLLSRRGQTRRHARGILVLATLTVALIGAILPRLDQFTQGALTARLQNTDVSGRDELIRDDLRLWSEHPLLGVGPAASQHHRTRTTTSHTEYSRLLAEHGLFGAAALATLVMMCIGRILRAGDSRERSLVVGLVSWSLLTMAHATMRTVSPAFILGLAFAKFHDGKQHHVNTRQSA